MKKIFSLIIIGLSLIACNPKTYRGTQYASLYNEKPKTILIAPPINKSGDTVAVDCINNILALPLIEKGYYVIPTAISMPDLEFDKEYKELRDMDQILSYLSSKYGADAVLFTIISHWKEGIQQRQVTAEAGISFMLKSTKSKETLFEKQGVVVVDMNQPQLIDGRYAAYSQIGLSPKDQSFREPVMAARYCSSYIFFDLPEGFYSAQFGRDLKERTGLDDFSVVLPE
ncbi:MAG: GNA1162 family protein [Tannerellaceae bacterium]